MIFTFTTLCLSKQSLPPPSLIHSAPACYIVYVIWSGLNIIYYLLFHYYSVIPSEHRGLKPLSGGQHIVPPELSWVTYWPGSAMVMRSQVWDVRAVTRDNHSLLQRHITCCLQGLFQYPTPSTSRQANCQVAPVRLVHGSLRERPTFSG